MSLYFYPVASWHLGIGIENGTIVLPTMLVDYSVF